MLANEQLRQAQEDLAARDSEVQELRSRLEELEKLQQQQMKLIELKDSELAAAQQRLAQVEQRSARGEGMGLWPLLVLLLVAAAAAAWWFARKPKPLPIPVSRGGRGFDAASLAAAAPSTQVHADPVVPVEQPELEPHPVEQDYVDEHEADPEPEFAQEEAEVAFAPEDRIEPEFEPEPEPATSREQAPAWHVDPVGFTPLNPSPAGRERLELAVAYLDLGDVETARTLLREVLAGQDPAARDEAAQLLRKIG